MAAPSSSPEPNFVMVAPDPATESVERLRRQALRLLTETREDASAEPPRPREAPRGEEDKSPSAAPSMIVGVLAMPAVFLAIVFVALAVFGKPGEAAPGDAEPATPMSAALPSAGLAPADATETRGVITLPDDARVGSIALDGDRVALEVEGPAGREIVIYDFRDGRRIASAAVETFSTEASDTLSMLTGPPPAIPAPVTPPPEPAPAATLPAYKVEPRLKPRSSD
jgi:hypothetical protein